MLLARASEGGSERIGTALPAAVADLLPELLHAMGQPLTTLQTLRLLGRAPVGAAVGERGVLEEMAEQVDRVTEIYQALRTVLEFEPVGDAGSLADQVRRLQGGWCRRALRRQVSVEFSPEFETESWGPARRPDGVKRALDLIFDEVLASVSEGGSVQVRTAVDEDGAEVAELAGGDRTRAGWAPGWVLRAAEAQIGAVGGAVVYSLEPFCARVTVCPDAPFPTDLPAVLR